MDSTQGEAQWWRTCLQGGRERFREVACFQYICFQLDAAHLLKAVELCGTLGFSHLQNHLQHRVASRRAFNNKAAEKM
jgi:hypothetical protein